MILNHIIYCMNMPASPKLSEESYCHLNIPSFSLQLSNADTQ